MVETNHRDAAQSQPNPVLDMPRPLTMLFGWEAQGVLAAFTERAGGVSKVPYESLNLSFHRSDAPELVLENHKRLAQAFSITTDDMVRGRQIHGARVVRVGYAQAGIAPDVKPGLDGVDALVTDAPGLMLLTSHADCMPVYFFDPVHRAIGMAHAGWSGILSGVVQAVLSEMKTVWGTCPADLRVGIGPHIQVCCFEVGVDVLHRFQIMPWWREGLGVEQNGSSYVHLERCVIDILEGHGVAKGRIVSANLCTRCAHERFFSHRGSGGHTGTGCACLMLRKDRDEGET